MNIKVCGITSLKQLQQLDGLDIGFAGLNFYKNSPRFVGKKIDADDLKNADLDIKTVGIFVNEEYDEIINMVEEFGLDAVQLHGDESPYLCEQLAEHVEVIKAFAVNNNSTKTIDQMVADYDEACDYYLFDTAKNGTSGGTGEKFNWQLLADAKVEKPFFISGGIGPADASLVKKFSHPDFFGVDINSLFEKEPGVKDMGLVLQFVNGLKK